MNDIGYTVHSSVKFTCSYPLGGSDFVGISNELVTIQSNSTMASFDITIRGDIIPETDEQFTVNITTVNPADQVVPPDQGIIIIIDEDEGKTLSVLC